MNDELTTRGLGDNAPPPDADPLLARLDEGYGTLEQRQAQLLAACARVPAVLTEQNHEAGITLRAQLQAHLKALDTAREDEKKPFLLAGRTVDGWFNSRAAIVKGQSDQLQRKIASYLQAKAAAERQRRLEEAERARAAAAEAEDAMRQEQELTEAVAAYETVTQLEQHADAPVRELARTHTPQGAMATLRREIAFEVVDRRQAIRTLADYFDADAVAKAARAYIARNRDSLNAQLVDETSPPVFLEGIQFTLQLKAITR